MKALNYPLVSDPGTELELMGRAATGLGVASWTARGREPHPTCFCQEGEFLRARHGRHRVRARR